MDKTPKKRAAVKVVKKVATKKSAKTVVKVLPAKKLLTKKPAKKTIKKSKVSKPEKSILPTTTPLKTRSTIEKTEAEVVNFIPGTVSLRLKEKVEIYSSWYQTKSFNVAEPITRVFGYLFITFGLFSAYTFSLNQSFPDTNMFATISCADRTCSNSVSNPTDDLPVQAVELPQVSFSTLPEIEFNQSTQLSVSTNRVQNFNIYFISLQTGKKTSLNSIGKEGENGYNYLIPTDTLPVGEYKIYTDAIALDGITRAKFTGPTFSIPKPLGIAPMATNTAAIIDENILLDNLQPDLEESSTSDEVINAIQTESETEANLNDEENNSIEQNTEQTTLSTSTVLTDSNFTVSLGSGVNPGQQRIFIKTNNLYKTIELSIRAKNSNIPLYLGEASQIKSGWLYWLDTTTLPTGNYSISLTATNDSRISDHSEFNFINNNTYKSILSTAKYEEQKLLVSNKIEELVASDGSQLGSLIDPKKPLIPSLLNTEEMFTTTLGLNPATDSVDIILLENKEVLNDLLKHYASTLVTGNINLIRLSEQKIDEAIEQILTTSVKSGSISSPISEVATSLQTKIGDIKDKIKKIQTLKEERTNKDSNLDTDGDGLTDYDEYLVYNTDPNLVDSDNDGITDGVEVSQGYNPLDASPEAIIKFNSPQNVSYVDENLIGINSVWPLLVYESEQEKPKVQSEISGFTLPNSFVTIYIFSEPSIAIVKSDVNGNFSYTFNKQLEDGRHQVYASLTDNEGKVVVSSSAYNFNKLGTVYSNVKPEIEAPVLDLTGSVITSDVDANIITAMGVVSLGLILLLLAPTLRRDSVKATPVTA